MKCKNCEKEIMRSEITKIPNTFTKTPKNFNFCSSVCCEKFLEELKEKEIEKKYYDELIKYIIEVLDVQFISPYFYSRLTDFKVGRVRDKSRKVITQTSGFTWRNILRTYQEKEKDIIWATQNVPFKNDLNKLLYTLAIIQNSIQSVKKQVEADSGMEFEDLELNKMQFKKQKDNSDISDLFN